MLFRNTRIWLALLAVCFATLANAQEKPEEPKPTGDETQQADGDALFDAGRNALFRGDYDEAIKSLQAAVATDPSNTKSAYRLQLARAYRYAKQFDKSQALLTDVLDKSPDHVEAGQLLAEIYYSQEKWTEVTQTLEQLLKYRHDYPTYHMLAEAAYYGGESDKSRGYYREAIKLNPKSAPDHYQLGNLYLVDNRFALAARAYEKALSLGLESNVLHYKLASAYFNLRNYFGRISEATIKAGQAGTISGVWYVIEPVSGQKDVFRVAPQNSAIYHIQMAIEGGLADRADTQMLLANIYLNARRYQQAWEMYKALGDKVPKEDQALYAYYFAQSAFGVDRYDEYLEQLKVAMEISPDAYRSALVDGYLKVAERYNQAGKLDQYIEHLKLAVDQNPQTASMHLKLGNAYSESRTFDQAIQQWRMVLDLEPEHPQRTELLNLIRKHG